MFGRRSSKEDEKWHVITTCFNTQLTVHCNLSVIYARTERFFASYVVYTGVTGRTMETVSYFARLTLYLKLMKTLITKFATVLKQITNFHVGDCSVIISVWWR
jgi:hypothetical protein